MRDDTSSANILRSHTVAAEPPGQRVLLCDLSNAKRTWWWCVSVTLCTAPDAVTVLVFPYFIFDKLRGYNHLSDHRLMFVGI